MGLDFPRRYGAERMADYAPQPALLGAPADEQAEESDVELDFEVPADAWEARPSAAARSWQVQEWPERPVRFIDGKDVGQTVAWLQAPGGYPVAVRLSEIGSVAVRVEEGVCRREFAVVEHVVSMVVDPFPWDEVESFAAALQEHGFRLLPAEWPKPKEHASYDFEQMRKAAQNRSNTEMGVLEEAALAQANMMPTVVDGRLEPRSGGLDQMRSPVVGVVKTHHQYYVHARGMQVLYRLAPGERTPLFALPRAKLPVVSWYVRLSGTPGAMPNWGLIRVELPLRWFERHAAGLDYVAQLSRMLCEYRCRDTGYARAPVSLHPIMRAEELLGALFMPGSLLISRFYRLTDL